MHWNTTWHLKRHRLNALVKYITWMNLTSYAGLKNADIGKPYCMLSFIQKLLNRLNTNGCKTLVGEQVRACTSGRGGW